MDDINNFKKKGFHFVHLNIRSILCRKKFEMFKQQLYSENIHMFGISESWLKNDFPSDLLNIEGYNLCRLDRNWSENGNVKKGGGICVYIKKGVLFSENKYINLNLSSKNIEMQWISLNQCNMRELVIVNLYRPPQGNIKEFCTSLHDCLATFDSATKREFFIMGDFNINAFEKELNNIMNSYGFKQFIEKTTRYSYNNKCIDLIYSNSDFVSNSGTLDWNYSDHQAIFISRKKPFVKHTKTSFVGRSYKHYNKEEFQDMLRSHEWNHFFSIEDPNICWNLFYDRIIETLDEFCQEKTFKISSYSEPWMNKEIMERIIDKDKSLKKAKRTNSFEDWDEAKRQRNNVGMLVDRAKSNYLENEFLLTKKDPKKFWRNIYSVIPKKKQSKKGQIRLKDDSGKDIDENRTAEYINDFFTNIGPKLAKKFDKEWDYFGSESENVIGKIKLTRGQIVQILKRIDISKSSGLEKISSNCLKDACLALSSQLLHIFEMSLKYCIFPNEWKIANIVPLFKGGIKEDVSNYRPVSLLPIPGKILESIIHDHIVTFFENNNLLCDHQGGFRKRHSTLSSITEFTNDIFHAVNNKNITIATFFDLKKAFDTVNHSILINKLSKMGIIGNLLDWIENYLFNRYQKTICNGKLSSKQKIVCGVPQGSILGPLLFLVYINDLESQLDDVNFQLYADDTVIYCSGKNSCDVKTKLQKCFNKFINWCNINQLSINTKKTKIMTFGTRHMIKNANNIEIYIEKEKLQSVPTYKYLGIHLDQTLNYEYHMKNVLKIISSKLYVFSKIRRFLSEKAALDVYKTMILPYFDYGDVIFMFSNENLLNKMDRLHLRGLKISKKITTSINDDELLNSCNISNLKNRRIVHLRNFMFNRKHLCQSNDDRDEHICTRSKAGPTYSIEKPNCEAFRRNVCYSGCIEWNNLNSNVRNLDNIFEFKKIQKKWLTETYSS